MKILKILALIPMVFVELVFLTVCWLAALIHTPTGRMLTEWSIEHLPAREWYFDDDDKAH